MAYLIYDKEAGETVTQFDYDPTDGGTKPLMDGFLMFEGEIDSSKNLQMAYRPNAEGTALVNPFEGMSIEDQTKEHAKEIMVRTATHMKKQKLGLIKTNCKKKLEDEFGRSSWKVEKAREQDLINDNNDAMRKLALEKQAIRDANNALETQLEALDPATDAQAIIDFDPADF